MLETLEGVITQFTAANGDKGASEDTLNPFPTDEDITVAMGVWRDDESEVDCISECIETVRENGRNTSANVEPSVEP